MKPSSLLFLLAPALCFAPLSAVSAQQPPPPTPVQTPAPPNPEKPQAPPEKDDGPAPDLDSAFGSSADISDPFTSGSSSSGAQFKKAAPARAKEKRQGFRVRMETWEIDAVELALRMDDGAPGWIEKMRQDCLKRTTQNRLIYSPSTTADERTPQSLESIAEEIYPTEWEPPSLPPADPKAPAPGAPTPQNASPLQKWLQVKDQVATPTSFETRNTGQTFAALIMPLGPEAQKGGQPPAWDLQMNFTEVLLEKNQPWGLKDLQITEPRFTNFHIETLVRVQPGRWTLVSAMEPPRADDKVVSTFRWVTVVRIDPTE